MIASTTVSRIIKAPRAVLYRACLDSAALETWRAPTNMKAKVHEFDARVGDRYRMSLAYIDPIRGPGGKTSEGIDSFQGRLVELVPDEKIVELIKFETSDPKFRGEMKMTTTFSDFGKDCEVTVLCENLPSGISLEDNELGCRLSLENLAKFVEPTA